MDFDLREEGNEGFAGHAAIPIAFRMDRVLEPRPGGGPRDLVLREQPDPWVKDYDVEEGASPASWPTRFDTSTWRVVSAWHRVRRRHSGTAAVIMIRNLPALLVCGTLACATTSEPAICAQPLTLTVQETSGLVFSWLPSECGVLTLTVSEDRTAKWHVFATVQAHILRPPILYGRAPAGDVAASQPAPLYPGITYRLRVTRFNQQGVEAIAGERTFRVDQLIQGD